LHAGVGILLGGNGIADRDGKIAQRILSLQKKREKIAVCDTPLQDTCQGAACLENDPLVF